MEELYRKILSTLSAYSIPQGINGNQLFVFSAENLGDLNKQLGELSGKYIKNYWEIKDYLVNNNQLYIRCESYDKNEVCYISATEFNEYLFNGTVPGQMITESYNERQLEIKMLGSKVLNLNELSKLKTYYLLNQKPLPIIKTGINWMGSTECLINDRYWVICSYNKGSRLDSINTKSSIQYLSLLCTDCGKVITRSVPQIREFLLDSGYMGCGCKTEIHQKLEEQYLNKYLDEEETYSVTDITSYTDKYGSVTSNLRVNCSCCDKSKYIPLDKLYSNSGKLTKICSCIKKSKNLIDKSKETLNDLKLPLQLIDSNRISIKEGDIVKTWRVIGFINEKVVKCECLHCGGRMDIDRDIIEDMTKFQPYSCGCVENCKSDLIKKYIRNLNNVENKNIQINLVENESITITCTDKKIKINYGANNIKINSIIGSLGSIPIDNTPVYSLTEYDIYKEINKNKGLYSELEVIQNLLHSILQVSNFTNLAKTQFLERDNWKN